MFLKSAARDEYGPITFLVNGILQNIPRSRSSDYKHIKLKSLFLNNKNNNTYSVHPNTDIQTVNEKKANEVICRYIWNNFFGLSKNYTYSEVTHYPVTFAIYLKKKLDVNVSGINTGLEESAVDNFILQVRNVIFTRILFLFKPYFIEITNSLIDKQPVTIHNDPMFEIKKQWNFWL